MKAGSHPAELLPFFHDSVARPFSFEFSKYVYRPQSTVDDREYFSVPSSGAHTTYEKLAASLKMDQDLALHSTLQLGAGENLHIPMIDLIGAFQDSWVAPLSDLMRVFGVKEFAVYSTGRSAHLYGLNLISSTDLVRFFARALLLNLPDKAPIVDARWIGHRLIAGCGSLRWSCNTKQYLQMPELLSRYQV